MGGGSLERVLGPSGWGAGRWSASAIFIGLVGFLYVWLLKNSYLGIRKERLSWYFKVECHCCYIQEKIDFLLEDGCSTRTGSSQRKRARGEWAYDHQLLISYYQLQQTWTNGIAWSEDQWTKGFTQKELLTSFGIRPGRSRDWTRACWHSRYQKPMLSHFQGPSKGWAPSDLTTKQATALVTRNMKRASAHFLLTNSPILRFVNKDNRSRSQSLKTLLPEGTLSVASFPCLLNSFQEIGLPLQTHLLVNSLCKITRKFIVPELITDQVWSVSSV